MTKSLALFVALFALAQASAAPPILQGIWIEPAAIAPLAQKPQPDELEKITRASLRAMKELGISVVILTYPEYFGTFFYPSNITFFDRDIQKKSLGTNCPFDVYSVVLDEADQLGLNIFLGVGRQGDSNLLWEFDKPDWGERLKNALSVARQVASELHEKYSRHPSFVGWYLSHEMNDLARASAYYDPLAQHCHQLKPRSRVLISPSGTPILTNDLITASSVDIFAYQDAVGAGYIPYRYTYQPTQRIAMLKEIFETYARLHDGTGKEIWANVEIWEMDGTQGYAAPYPAPFERVRQQIDIESPHVKLLTGYAWHGFMQPPSATHEKPNPIANKLFEEYANYRRSIKP
jgi:hypothetical protein